MIKTINKSVRDNYQIATLDKDKIIIVSKIGRKIAFKYEFEVQELLNYNPTFNKSYNIHDFLKNKIQTLNLKWFNFLDPFYTRILDAQMYAVLDILKKNGTEI